MSNPTSQVAVQLVDSDKLVINREKPVPVPGPTQFLAKTEAVGLCFSDMKLLHQFAGHPRKSEIVSGIDPQVLRELPSYAPGDRPTVPGHEVVVRVVAVGGDVQGYKAGERWLIQPDFRALKTTGSNGACGYNFEGALQEYVLLDERIVGRPEDEGSYMISAPEGLSASSIALVEPWGCVENSYVTRERRWIKPDGRLLVVAPEGFDRRAIESLAKKPDALLEEGLGVEWLPDEGFDDIVYFGHNPEVIESLSPKLASHGIFNLVLGGRKIGRPVSIGVGRIHYGYTRWVGTTGGDPNASYAMIPETGDLRENDSVLIVGAGGPMGQMHTIRALSSKLPGIQVVASDVDDARLRGLASKASGLRGTLQVANPKAGDVGRDFTYVALMAPVPELLVDSIGRCAPGAIVNVFAGIPAPVSHPIDLDQLIEKQVFVFGTSGSDTRDMKIVLAKLVGGELDTDMSVSAISGMAGAIDGLTAVRERTMDGKILVYPALHEVGLIPLSDLDQHFPTVSARLNGGRWCRAAEEELLRVAVA